MMFSRKKGGRDRKVRKLLFYERSDKFSNVINNHASLFAGSMLSPISAIYKFHVYCRGTRNKWRRNLLERIAWRALEWTVYQSFRDKQQIFLECPMMVPLRSWTGTRTSRIERNCIIRARKARCYGRGAYSREPGSRCITAVAMFPVGVASSSRGSTYANEARDRAHRLPTI